MNTDNNPAKRGQLTNGDHANLTAYAGHVLDAYRDGSIDRLTAIEAIADVVAAVDTGDYGTARNHIERGRKQLLSGERG